MSPETPVEREVKLRFPSADTARAAVLGAGMSPLRGRRLQEDTLLDTNKRALGRKGCTLRVRTEAGKSRITFKGPAQPSIMKVREELETLIGDSEVLLEILGRLGFKPWFRYQKYREEFSGEDVVVAVDETPIGVYLELEGGEDGILAIARALGRGEADFIRASYLGLFEAWRAEHGQTGSDMVFESR
jgi:adenylate cyclase, class 2